MKKQVLIGIALAVSAGAMGKTYEPDWASLSKHEAAPEWLKDAKLGIYFHWGVYSVPAYGNEWYPCRMHQKWDDVYTHHVATYGEPSEFGYHDFVPMFTGEHFDPEEWAELFKKAGARFAGPVAEHHDGFAMWASKITPWNAMDRGPHRDILGELFKALEKRNMKTIATFHHARNLQRYRDTWDDAAVEKNPRNFFDSHYPFYADMPPASDDPELRLLYGNLPAEEWHEKIWLGELEEVIDQYRPDMIWFDSWLDKIPETYRQRFAAHYLNAAEEWGKEVAIIRKQDDLPINFTINDHEKSREPNALPELWMTDDTISTGSWCYTTDLTVKPLYKILHTLADTVSKNGVVLLNLSPMADGTIPQDQRRVLLGLGAWLETHGEAIYDTRPWTVAAEGPTAEPTGGFAEHKKFLKLEYCAEDIRYTASKDGKTVYAMLLGIPTPGSSVLLTAFGDTGAVPETVSLMNGNPVKWSASRAGLRVIAPESMDPKSNMVVFKIRLSPENRVVSE